MKRYHKRRLRRKKEATIFKNEEWDVNYGHITAGPGGTTPRLFRYVAEKIPVEALKEVEDYVRLKTSSVKGIYLVLDSMSYPRYAGRGNVFDRIRARVKKHKAELKYFSFYLVESKKHERELETLLVHNMGTLLLFNTLKKREGTKASSIWDYEAGTKFVWRRDKNK